MKNNRIANCVVVLALIAFAGAIVMKVGFNQDPVITACVGGLLLSSGVLLKKNASN